MQKKQRNNEILDVKIAMKTGRNMGYAHEKA
jgi:hypothetical protein